MQRCDPRDLIAGGALIAVGLAAGIHASTTYPVGTLRQMGPGMFPASLGYMLAGLGFAIAVPAMFRSGVLPVPEWRPFAAVCCAVLAFAFSIRTLGLVPAVLLTTAVSILADNKLGYRGAIVLAAALSIFAVTIFVYGLGMPLQVVNWRLTN